MRLPPQDRSPGRYTGTQIQAQVSGFLAASGLDVRRQNTVAFRAPGKGGKTRLIRSNEKGTPDLWTLLPGGRLFAVECKATGELPTQDQGNQILRINRQGGFALWCDDVRTVELALKAALAGNQCIYLTPIDAVFRPFPAGPAWSAEHRPLEFWPAHQRRVVKRGRSTVEDV